MLDTLGRYRDHGFYNVEGWCNEALFPLIDLLCQISQPGGVCEIGVHHGKFFLMLNQVTDQSERSFAIDLFDEQSLNIDSSGSGSLATFQRNLELYDVHQGRNTTIIQADSTDSRAISQIVDTIGTGSIRLFSVDGGHTARHTISDLQLASDLTSNSGVVVLDDILNYHWIGVIEGAVKYLLREPVLVPFAIGHNKLFLCKLSYYDRYFSLFAPLQTKIVPFLGTKLVAL